MTFCPCFQVSPSKQSVSSLNLVLHIFITELQGAPSEEMLPEGRPKAAESDGTRQPRSAHASYTLLRGLAVYLGPALGTLFL